MKERILTGWSLRRAMFVAFGSYIVYTSAMDKSWLGVFLGGYFLSMGLFAFGCASGNCYGGSCTVTPVSEATKIENK